MTEIAEEPITTIEEESSPDWLDEPEDINTQTALHNKYSFWFHRRGQSANKGNYEENILKLATCQTAEHFWRIHDHLIKPNDIKVTIDYHLFKDGIKPMWEDPANKSGGKWMIRVKKGLSSHYWEDLLLAIIGEQFDVGHELCGAVLSIRSGEDIISVWNKNSENIEATNKIRDQMRRILKLPAFVPIEYKKHQDSLIDNSSFRNPNVVWRAHNRADGPPGHGHGGHHSYNNQGGYNRDGGGNYQQGSSPRSSGDRPSTGANGGAPAGFQPRSYTQQQQPGATGNTNSSPRGNASQPSFTSGSPRNTEGAAVPKPPSRWDSLNSNSSTSPRSAGAAAASENTTAAAASNAGSATSPRAGGAPAAGAWRSGSAAANSNAWNKSATSTTATSDNSAQSTAAAPAPAATAAVAGTDGTQSNSLGKNLGGWFKSQLSKGQEDTDTSQASTSNASEAKPKFSWNAPK